MRHIIRCAAMLVLLMIISGCAGTSSASHATQQASNPGFRWPKGIQGAVILSYDDALPVHFERVAPALEAAGLRGTFYITIDFDGFRNNLEAWRKVALAGHELGNHSLFHPCRKDKPGQHPWLSDDYDLTKYTPDRWIQEMRVANCALQLVDGKDKRTFGNTCCDNFIGPINNQTSLEKLIPQLFVAGRGRITSRAIDPNSASLAALGHFSGDGKTFERLRNEIEAAVKQGKWIFYMIHGVGKGTHSSYIDADEHQKLLDYLKANRHRIWTAPAVEVATYLKEHSR
jgi:peptidoglycan/xylan/chitin deacetylase (PgdA/CDA1 family)